MTHRLIEAAKEMRKALKYRDEPSMQSRACFCTGPRDGQPLCPCQMHGVQNINGRLVRVIDLGAAPSEPSE